MFLFMLCSTVTDISDMSVPLHKELHHARFIPSLPERMHKS